jgi:hypothetical protein
MYQSNYTRTDPSRGETLCSEIHKLINYIWNKEELPEQCKESFIVPVHENGDIMDCSNYQGILLLWTTQNFIQHSLVKVNSMCRQNYLGSPVWIST